MPKMTASGILQKYWDRKIPVDVKKIVENFGGIAVQEDIINGYSGMTYKTDNGYTIVLNKDQPDLRKRFTLAHEFGHIVMGHTEKAEILYRDNLSSPEFWIRDRDEQAANQFAAEILMPEKAIAFLLRKYDKADTRELAMYLHVSEQAMAIRLNSLDLRELLSDSIF